MKNGCYNCKWCLENENRNGHGLCMYNPPSHAAPMPRGIKFLNPGVNLEIGYCHRWEADDDE